MIGLFLVISLPIFTTVFFPAKETVYSLTVQVNELRNANGTVQVALYNQEGSLPDEHYTKYYRLLRAGIQHGSSEITFKALPRGTYAVSILHDENNNGKIDRGFILPKEGIGFSNVESIGMRNKPSFTKASFELNSDKSISVKVLYF